MALSINSDLVLKLSKCLNLAYSMQEKKIRGSVLDQSLTLLPDVKKHLVWPGGLSSFLCPQKKAFIL